MSRYFSFLWLERGDEEGEGGEEEKGDVLDWASDGWDGEDGGGGDGSGGGGELDHVVCLDDERVWREVVRGLK